MTNNDCTWKYAASAQTGRAYSGPGALLKIWPNTVVWKTTKQGELHSQRNSTANFGSFLLYVQNSSFCYVEKNRILFNNIILESNSRNSFSNMILESDSRNSFSKLILEYDSRIWFSKLILQSDWQF